MNYQEFHAKLLTTPADKIHLQLKDSLFSLASINSKIHDLDYVISRTKREKQYLINQAAQNWPI